MDNLLELGTKQLRELFHARARRKFNRGLNQNQKGLVKKLRKSKREAAVGDKPEAIKTHLRDAIIVPEMIGSIVGVHNGKGFTNVEIKVIIKSTINLQNGIHAFFVRDLTNSFLA